MLSWNDRQRPLPSMDVISAMEGEVAIHRRLAERGASLEKNLRVLLETMGQEFRRC